MEIWQFAAIMWGLMLILLLLGCPVAFALGSLGTLGSVYAWGGIKGIFIVASTAADVMTNPVLLAIPLFIFMAILLEFSGVTDGLFELMHRWMGFLPGGLAIGTTAIGAILGAMMGAAPASTATMCGVALDPMLKRGYDKKMATGCIAAGGALSILIPPSILMIVYASLTGVSPGAMFAGGMIPGIIITLIFMIFIGIISTINQNFAPPAKDKYSWKEKMVSLKGIIFPFSLILMVLGSIYTGIATTTEAASVGAFGGLLTVVIYKRKEFIKILKLAIEDTIRISVFIFWIILAANVFSCVMESAGVSGWVRDIVVALSISKWLIMFVMQVILLILGCILDPLGIMMITLPVYFPIIISFGFDPLWFGVLFIINMAISFITPPIGFNLFVMRGMVPSSITLGDIIRGSFPFTILYAMGLFICILFPKLVTWLPSLLIVK